MTRALRLAALLSLCLLAAPAAWAKGPRIEELKTVFRDGQVVVSFGLGGAFERTDLQEAVQSTRPVTLTFSVEVVKKRLLWKNKVLGRRTVTRRITYDTLTRQYTVETDFGEGSPRTAVAASWEELAQACSRVDDLPVCPVADMEPDGSTYTLRAKVRLLEGFTLWIIPWDVETPWADEELKTP